MSDKRISVLPCRDARNNEAGFGLIEIQVALLGAAILTVVSVLIFGNAKASYELRHDADAFAQQIERAKSIAIKKNQTLTLGFTGENTSFALTCDDCAEAKEQLPALTISGNLKMSDYPALTVKGNGTIQATSSNITISDAEGRNVQVTISNSGRVVVGSVQDSSDTK